MKRVAIILLNWNGWQDTSECISSLVKLNFSNYWTIIIDNASSNDSVLRLRQSHPHATIVVNEKNLGFGGGCNIGIKQAFNAGADYVWLLNNDTTVNEYALTALVQEMDSNPITAAVGSVLYHMDDPSKIQAWGGARINLWTGRATNLKSPVIQQNLDYLTGASILLRKEAIEQIGLFDESFFMYWEDSDLCFRLRGAGWRLAVAERSIVLHKGSASFEGNNPLLMEYFTTSLFVFFYKHAPIPILPILFSACIYLFKHTIRAQLKISYHIILGIRNGIRLLQKI